MVKLFKKKNAKGMINSKARTIVMVEGGHDWEGAHRAFKGTSNILF